MDIWQNRMVLDGKRFGKLGESMAFGWEGQVWYYDGGRVYLADRRLHARQADSGSLGPEHFGQYAVRASAGVRAGGCFRTDWPCITGVTATSA